MKKILFIQHAGDLGGSAVSLYSIISGIDYPKENIDLLLIRPNQTLNNYYKEIVNKIIAFKGYTTFEHTTGKSYTILNPKDIYSLVFFPLLSIKSIIKSIYFIKNNNYDVYHLNSVVLTNFALALIIMNKKFIWHVREHPVSGILGLRKFFIKKILCNKRATVLFLTKSARKAWVNDFKGVIVKNFYNKKVFDTNKFNNVDIKEKYDLPLQKKIILYVGGRQKIKGIWVLLESLNILVNKFNIDLICLMPGILHKIEKKPLKLKIINFLLKSNLNFGSYYIEKYISEKKLDHICLTLPFNKNIAELITISDILIFPSIKPHFARPIIEAAALKVPSIGSELEGVKELIIDGETGILVSPNNHLELALSIKKTLENELTREKMGEKSYKKINDEYDSETEISKIKLLYKTII